MKLATFNIIHTTPRKTPDTKLHHWLEYRNQQYNLERMNNNVYEYKKGLDAYTKLLDDMFTAYRESLNANRVEFLGVLNSIDKNYIEATKKTQTSVDYVALVKERDQLKVENERLKEALDNLITEAELAGDYRIDKAYIEDAQQALNEVKE